MGVITKDTFDPIRAFCNVRLQQGVPLVDADVNELDAIRKFEVRAFLKWFVGDGIPAGNDGFRIDAIGGVADDFWIRAGSAAAPAGTPNTEVGLRYVGRAIVDGLDVIIPADVKYKSQAMFAGPAVDGSPQIQPIPNVAASVTVYLDVWERPVSPQEDTTLVLPSLGTESCARIKREWCVRTVAAASPPAPPAGHSYYPLATLNRKISAPNVPVNIVQADLTERRHMGLSVTGMDTRLSKLEALLLLPVFAAANSLAPFKQVTGGTVLITGRNFTIGTPVVTIGGLPAALFSAATPTQLSVTVPNLTVGGPYPVLVSTDGGGPVACPIQLTVLPGGGPPPPPPPPAAPTLDATHPFLPTSSKAGLGINILGASFDAPNLKVTFNTIAATIQGSTAGQITVTVPAVAPGPYTIHVTTDGGTVATAAATPFTVTS